MATNHGGIEMVLKSFHISSFAYVLTKAHLRNILPDNQKFKEAFDWTSLRFAWSINNNLIHIKILNVDKPIKNNNLYWLWN